MGAAAHGAAMALALVCALPDCGGVSSESSTSTDAGGRKPAPPPISKSVEAGPMPDLVPIPSPVENAVPVVVGTGATLPYVNGLFVSATICVPGSNALCQTVDNLLVDTGSTGLRIVDEVLTVNLPRSVDTTGAALATCAQFADGTFLWGGVALADIRIGGEIAEAVPIQIAAAPGASGFAAPPAACASGGGQNTGSVAELDANGILGLSFFREDCGSTCVSDSSPGVYYRCSGATCAPTTLALAQQLPNPIAMFGADANGSALSLPDVPPSGTTRVGGTLTFGIGTQSNNALGGATVLPADANGSIATVYNGRSYGSTLIDSGSNAFFFLSTRTSGMATCATHSDFYCPASPAVLTATLTSPSGASGVIDFSVANGDALLAADDAAFDDLAGPNIGARGFVWGLPFFLGRTVFTAIEAAHTPAGAGPYWAYAPLQ
jgi:hypothetical protein